MHPHRRRVTRIIRSCAGKFGLSLSLRPAQPSSTSPSPLLQATVGVGIFYPAVLLRLRPPWRPSLLVPSATASSCASSLARPVLATPMRAHRPWRILEPGKPGHVSPDCLTASTSASLPLRLSRRIAIFFSGVLTITPPPWHLLVRPRLHVQLPRLRQPRQLYVDHGYPTHGIIDHGYSPSRSATSTSAQRATIRMSYSPIFSPVSTSAPHRRYDCGGMLVRWLLLSASSPISPFAVIPL